MKSNYHSNQGGKRKSDRFASIAFFSFSAMAVFPGLVNAQSVKKEEMSTSSGAAGTVESKIDTERSSFLSRFSANYFMYFNGPGIAASQRDAPPNNMGRPDDNGISTFNLISFRYKLSEKFGLDVQTRSELFFNERAPRNGRPVANFRVLRWESPRIGISGNLMSGDNWKINGAVNTDIPYMLPSPLTGYTSRQRTSVINPGMFASHSYTPSGSNWSTFTILAPRFFVYADQTAIEPEGLAGGSGWKNKPHFVLFFSPTVNYRLSDKWQATAGVTLDYWKQMGSGWNPTNASLVGNGESTAWRLRAVPVQLGATFTASKNFRIFPYIESFPIAAQRIDATNGRQAGLLETARIGMWISGNIF